VWLASPATDGKTGLEVKELTAGKMLASVLRLPLNKISGRPEPEIKMTVTTVPPAGRPT
jgi:hypothetical protein